jgi:hypothetical protein
MSSVLVSDDMVHVVLNKSIYPKKYIETALSHFKPFMDAEIHDDTVILKPNKEAQKQAGYEFCNYVLALMKNDGN